MKSHSRLPGPHTNPFQFSERYFPLLLLTLFLLHLDHPISFIQVRLFIDSFTNDVLIDLINVKVNFLSLHGVDKFLDVLFDPAAFLGLFANLADLLGHLVAGDRVVPELVNNNEEGFKSQQECEIG